MKLKNAFFITYILLILFTFIYTLKINLNFDKKLNTYNMTLLFLFFIIWLFSWYIFFIKDILKSNQLERNRIGLVLILLAIIGFYYNPFPLPNNYELEINRHYYFYFTVFTFINCIIFSYEKPYFFTSIILLTPVTINSFFTNIIKNDIFFQKYPYFTLCFVVILMLIYFLYKTYSNGYKK